MATSKIKICGIRDEAALDAAISASADYVGLVFFPPSPRNVSAEEARGLSARADKAITKVGLFVDADDTVLAEAIAAGNLDALQLHGEEAPERCAQVKARFGLPVWKAIPITDQDDVTRAGGYSGAVDLLLFDAKTPNDAALPGGMGLRFDWSLLASYRGPIPWGLAGGLPPNNVVEAIAATGAPLVDTSSGVESALGIKDPEMIAAFCDAVREA